VRVLYHRVLLDEEAFLRRFHQERPGVTTAALARGRVAGGGSSYDLVARAIPVGGRVVDLGCGDGFLLARLIERGHRAADLVGIDLSADELRAARARAPEVAGLHARAQALPLAGRSCAAVVSHLAFTLMPGLDAIAHELLRVLAAGGRFVALVGGGPRGDDAFAGFLDLALPHVQAAPPTPRLGDRRARTDDGLATVLAGFASLAVDDVTIDVSGTADEVWGSLSTGYELATLAPAARAALHAAFLAEAPRWRRADGLIAATMYGRLVTAIR
jgi:SAM-dependent methyltransferase